MPLRLVRRRAIITVQAIHMRAGWPSLWNSSRIKTSNSVHQEANFFSPLLYVEPLARLE